MKQKQLKNTIEKIGVTIAEQKVKKTKKEKFGEAHAKVTWLSRPKQKEEDDTGNIQGPGSDSKNGDAMFVYVNPTFVPDEAFELFLQKYDTSKSNIYQMNALQYLKREKPFKGKHMKAYKGSLKEAGVKWFKNENHVPGDWNSTFGWYVACSIKDLKAVLQLPLTKDGNKAWHPIDLEEEDVHVVCRYVLEVLDEFEDKKNEELERQRLAALSSKNEKERRLRQGAVGLVVDDRQGEIERLVRVLSIEGESKWKYDPELIKSSSTSDRLGPAMSTNALRVLRALHLKILTPSEVRNADFHGYDIRVINKQRIRAQKRVAERSQLSSSQSSSLLTSKLIDQCDATCQEYMNTSEDAFDMFEKQRVFLRTDGELERLKELEVVQRVDQEATALINNPMFAHSNSLVIKPVKEAICKACDSKIDDQFGCNCFAVKWTTCRTCLYPTSEMQKCMCSCMDVEFPVENAEEQNLQKDVKESSVDSKDDTTKKSVDVVSDSNTTKHDSNTTKHATTSMSSKKMGKQSVRFVKLTPTAAVNEVDPDL